MALYPGLQGRENCRTLLSMYSVVESRHFCPTEVVFCIVVPYDAWLPRHLGVLFSRTFHRVFPSLFQRHRKIDSTRQPCQKDGDSQNEWLGASWLLFHVSSDRSLQVSAGLCSSFDDRGESVYVRLQGGGEPAPPAFPLRDTKDKETRNRQKDVIGKSKTTRSVKVFAFLPDKAEEWTIPGPGSTGQKFARQPRVSFLSLKVRWEYARGQRRTKNLLQPSHVSCGRTNILALIVLPCVPGV